MENNIEPEVIHFLDQYYNNSQIEGRDFLQAVREKISQIKDPKLQEEFIYAIIEKGQAMRDCMEQQLRELELYKLRGDE